MNGFGGINGGQNLLAGDTEDEIRSRKLGGSLPHSLAGSLQTFDRLEPHRVLVPITREEIIGGYMRRRILPTGRKTIIRIPGDLQIFISDDIEAARATSRERFYSNGVSTTDSCPPKQVLEKL
jgi:hypothetical protein